MKRSLPRGPQVAVDSATNVESTQDVRGDRGGAVRSVLTVSLGVIAIIVLMVTTVAVWAEATAFNSAKVAGIVGDALEEREVEVALAEYITAQVFKAVDVDAAVAAAIPGQEQLATVIVAGANAAVERGLTEVLSEPEVREIVTDLVERAHHRAMQLLEGDGVGNILVVDGEVTLNLLPLISRGLTKLQDLGLAKELDVPELTADGDPDEQIAQLEQATGRDLPDDFGQLVVYKSDRLADRTATLDAAQRIVALAKRAVWVLVGLTVVSIAITVLLARDRWRAALGLGLGAIAAMVIVRSAVHRVVDEAPDLAKKPGGRAAISAILEGASTGLLRLTGVVMIVAAAAVVVALLRRHWPRYDLVEVGAFLAFAVTVAVLGISVRAVLIGLVLASLAVAAARFAWRGSTTAPPPSEPRATPV